MAEFREFRIKWRYEILLLSFMFLLFGDIFFTKDMDSTPILIFQNVLASAFIFSGKKNWKFPILFYLIFLFVVELINLLVGLPKVRLVFSSTYIVYFLILAVTVYHQIIRARDVDLGMISAVLCGFIILGMIGGYVFSIIEVLNPNSFTNLGKGPDGFSDLIYFSFITILSIGYGDITPLSDVAQKMAMFFGLIGYFYGVVVIGIIMGKYLSKK